MAFHLSIRVAAAGLALAIMGGAPLMAASVPELLQQVAQSLKPDELEEAGSTVRAKAIGALLGEELGLSPTDRLELRLAEAEAWLDAGLVDETETRLTAILRAGEATPAIKERAGLAWIAAWQLAWKQAEKPAEVPEVAEQLKAFGDLGAKVAARVHTAEARRLLALKAKDGVLEHFDQALALLATAKPGERMPIYTLRMLAMEELGAKPEEVQSWIQAHSGDPAAAEILDTAMTASEKLVGQPAPALKLKRLDGQAGEIDLTAYAGKRVLIDFFATWCQPCEGVASGIAAAAAKLAPAGLVTIGVSLDTKETLKNLPAWIAKHGIAYPVIGEGLGWDGETDDAWHVDAIPALIMVGEDGKIIANELVGASAEETERNIELAFKGRAADVAPAGGAPAAQPPPAKQPAPPAKPAGADPGFVP